jgi:hypothetical protein
MIATGLRFIASIKNLKREYNFEAFAPFGLHKLVEICASV